VSRLVASLSWQSFSPRTSSHRVGRANVGHPTGARAASPGSGAAAIYAGTSADSGILSRHQKFFCNNVFHRKATPFMGQVFVRGAMSNFQNPKVPLPGGRTCRTHIQARLRCAEPSQFRHACPRRLPRLLALSGENSVYRSGVLDSITSCRVRRMHPGETKVHRRERIAASRFLTVQERCITYTVGDAQARFIRMKSASRKRTPSIVRP
jgi:hypothetical protein